MAYELVGIQPKSYLGICVRMNIWIWKDFLELLFKVGAISSKEKQELMFNDCGLVFDGTRCTDISNKIAKIIDNQLQINGNHLRLAYMFLSDCGGFYIR
jgi:hypothetical protein